MNLFSEGRGVKMLHTYIHTYRHTDRHTGPLTKWVVEELSLLKKGMHCIAFFPKPVPAKRLVV